MSGIGEDPFQAQDPWSTQDSKGRVRPAGPKQVILRDYMPPGLSSLAPVEPGLVMGKAREDPEEPGLSPEPEPKLTKEAQFVGLRPIE